MGNGVVCQSTCKERFSDTSSILLTSYRDCKAYLNCHMFTFSLVERAVRVIDVRIRILEFECHSFFIADFLFTGPNSTCEH